MAIEGLLALEQLSVTDARATITGELSKAQSCARMGVLRLPGIPDIPDMIDAWIVSNWEGLKIEIRTECEEFLSKVEGDANKRVIEEINKFIKKLNDFVKKLNKLMSTILALMAPICPIITAITIIMIVAKVITLIPSFGAGMGAVVVATFPGNIAGAIYSFASDILNKINKVPFALISVMNLIIGMYEYIVIIYNRIRYSIQRQQDLLAQISAALLRSADDWLDIDYDRKAEADAILAGEMDKLKQWDKFNSDMVNLGKDFKDAISDLSVRLGLQLQINNLEKQIYPPLDDGDGDGEYAPPIPPLDGDDGYGGYSPPTPPPRPSPYTDGNGNIWAWFDPPGEWRQPTGESMYQGIPTAIGIQCPITSPPTDALWEKYPESYFDECGDKWVCNETNDPENICDWQKDGTNIFDGTDTPDGISAWDVIPEITSPYTDEFGNSWEWKADPPPGDWVLIATPPLPPETPFVGDGNLINLHNGLLVELDNLGGPLTHDELITIDEKDRVAVQGLFASLDNTIITSLLYPHSDVTIQKATAKKGKRYGFYQSDIKR